MSVIGNNPQFGKFFKLDQILGTGDSSYTMNLNGNPQSTLIAEQLLVSINGTMQNPNSAFTISGSTITFSEAIDSDDTIDFITVMGEAHNVATVSDNTITALKLSDAIGVTDTPESIVIGPAAIALSAESRVNPWLILFLFLRTGVSVVLHGSFTVV